jgi:hypothetical protein
VSFKGSGGFASRKRLERGYGGVGLGLALFLVAFVLWAPARVLASSYEQLPPPDGIFAGAGEEVQLGGVGGMAVNVDGAGGAPSGVVYAATQAEGGVRVARFSPEGKFELAWQVTPVEGPYERCGPKVEGEPPCPTRPSASVGGADVDIDQSTGYVYVFNERSLAAGRLTVRVYSPDGSKVITRFGELAAGGEATAATPGKIHESPYPGGIAVNDDGEVYVFDVNFSDSFYHRLMVFKPQTPGDYEHYVYAGQGSDIGVGTTSGRWPSEPAVDAEGDVYVAGYEGDYIEKYDPAQPASSICKFELKISGITAYVVDRVGGGVFYYTYKKTPEHKEVHQLAPCSGGKFNEIGKATVAPERDDLYAMAFNPVRQATLTRDPGTLYAGAPSAVPATGVGEPGKTSLGYIFAPVEEDEPVIDGQSVANVTAGTAELRALINPKGFQTEYVFQYLTEAAYQEGGEGFGKALEAPAGGALLGAGQLSLSAAVTLTGLVPGTAYRYRVIARSSCSAGEPSKVCEAIGSTQTFFTFAPSAPGLPDVRAWELVSPAHKNGGQVLPAEPNLSSCKAVECKPGGGAQHFPLLSTADGNRIVYEGTSFTASGGGVMENQYLGQRTASGWATTNLTPPLLASKGGRGYKAFDPELTMGILEQVRPSLSPEAPPLYDNLYRQPSAGPTILSPLLTEAPPNRLPANGINSLKVTYAGAAADLSQIFFEANDALTPEAFVGNEDEMNLYEWSDGELHLVNLAPGNVTPVVDAVFGSGMQLEAGTSNIPVAVVSDAISADGSHVFWSSKAGQVYVRIAGTETVELEDHVGKFVTASTDGSRVLLSDGCLYDLEEAACKDLTGGQAGFEGIVGKSEGLSRIYFVDSAVLDATPNGQGAMAEAGKDNLYVWEEGVTAYVATLVSQDGPTWEHSPVLRTGEASPDGRWLTFLSRASLTGFDNVGPCEALSTGEAAQVPCPEVFLYDSLSGELICASCSPSNARPLGPSTLRLILNVQGSMPQPRYLTNSGRLYFDSGDSLVPADSNVGVEDVYQYEPEGVGGCRLDGGCIDLISAGRESVDSNLLAVDETGDNVFFTTRDRLVPSDRDELLDLYDARVGGGFTPEALPQGSREQPSPPVPPRSIPISSSLADPGNMKPRGCKKGRVKRKGRCVKRPNHKKQRKKNAKQARGGAR